MTPGAGLSDDDAPLLVIVGPTASGKTELAVSIAERIDGEVISADSVQVYRRFDVGSGKPTKDELGRARHHLVDAVDPLEAMDAARWASLAEEAIADVRRRGKRAIVCGGAFLWVRALLYGLAAAPPADEAIRAAHRAVAETDGRAALHARLTEVDPVTAARLGPNDFVRVSRALEVFELTATRMSDLQQRHGFSEQRYASKLLGIERSRDELDDRIARRVRAMFDAGWIAEVSELLEAGLGEARAMGSVGYRQIAEAITGGEVIDVEELKATIGRATRVFARRQRTWLRDQPVHWLDPEAGVPDEVLGR